MGKLFASEVAERAASLAVKLYRRLRLHEGLPGREALPRREDRPDLRGHDQHAAADDRQANPGLIALGLAWRSAGLAWLDGLTLRQHFAGDRLPQRLGSPGEQLQRADVLREPFDDVAGRKESTPTTCVARATARCVPRWRPAWPSTPRQRMGARAPPSTSAASPHRARWPRPPAAPGPSARRRRRCRRRARRASASRSARRPMPSPRPPAARAPAT